MNKGGEEGGRTPTQTKCEDDAHSRLFGERLIFKATWKHVELISQRCNIVAHACYVKFFGNNCNPTKVHHLEVDCQQ